MICPSRSSYAWALHEFQHADFPDERLTQRVMKVAATFLDHPQESIPAACGSWADTKGTYRFFNHQKITNQSILHSHYQETRDRCNSEPTILVAQDTTTMNLSNKQVDGAGRIGEGTLTGCFTHSALALNTEGMPLGLLYQKTYVRKEGTNDPEYKKRYKRIPIKNKETVRWIEAIEEVSLKLLSKHTVVIGDRESDIFDVFHCASKYHVDVLIRTAWNRNVLDPEDSAVHVSLFERVKQSPIMTILNTVVPADNHGATREAKLTIRTCPFLLQPPKHRRKTVIPVLLTIIDVKENEPPEGIEPIHWMLTTSLPVTTADDCIEKIRWYMYRWKIERFHFILKTGAFNVEKLQFKSIARFAKAIALLSVVACRILWIIQQERDNPQQTADTAFSSDELHALKRLNHHKEEQSLTLKQAMAALAKLGGYLGRKHDSPAGIKILWKGFQKLQYIVIGMNLSD